MRQNLDRHSKVVPHPAHIPPGSGSTEGDNLTVSVEVEASYLPCIVRINDG